MKLKASEIAGFLKKPPAHVRAVVIYGPDGGLVRERAKLLLNTLADNPDDPFSVADLDEQALKGDPARLADEAGAVAMFGDRRVVRVRDAGEAAAKALEGYLGMPGDGFVVLEAGELTPRSALRKLAESSKEAAALPCYADNAEALERLSSSMLREAGLDAAPDVIGALVDQLGADRQLSRNEIEKLILYKGGESPVTLEDIAASIGGADGRGLDDVIDAAAGGDMEQLDRTFARLVESGVAPERMIRALTMHLERLHLVLGRIERGGRLDEVLRSLRPPVHFSRQPALKRQCAVWSRRRLDGALTMLGDAEANCRGAGDLSGPIVARAMMGIAHAAQSGRHR